MTNNQPSESRWQKICDLYKKQHERQIEERDNISRLVHGIRNVFVKACGCSEDKVTHYRYEGENTEQDGTFTSVKSPIESVVGEDECWFFAYGISLEMGPNIFPKTTMTFPVKVKYEEGIATIECPLLKDNYIVDMKASIVNLEPLGENLYQGLISILEMKEVNNKKIGFV